MYGSGSIAVDFLQIPAEEVPGFPEFSFDVTRSTMLYPGPANALSTQEVRKPISPLHATSRHLQWHEVA